MISTRMMMMISMMVGMMVGMTATAAQHAAEEMSLRTPLADLLQWKRMEEEAGRFTHFEAGMPCACALTEPSHPFEIDCGKEDMEHVLEAWRVLTSEPACMSGAGRNLRGQCGGLWRPSSARCRRVRTSGQDAGVGAGQRLSWG